MCPLAPSQLNWEFGGKRSSNESYTMEELIAELGSDFPDHKLAKRDHAFRISFITTGDLLRIFSISPISSYQIEYQPLRHLTNGLDRSGTRSYSFSWLWTSY